MKDTSTATLPTFQQMLVLAFEVVGDHLAMLDRIRIEDKDFPSEDAYVEYGVQLATLHLTNMRAKHYANRADFDEDWFMALAPLELGLKAVSRPDSYYGRTLKATCLVMDRLVTLVEFASDHPEKKQQI